MINYYKPLGALTMALPLISCSSSNHTPVRPNIVVIFTDDMGYSDVGCYGGEIQTPNIDELARNGLRWAQFYNNARSCPSRAALMTGLYPHQTGMGWMACADEGPQYQGYLNNNCVTIAEVLGASGYETYMCGKWHLCSERQCSGDVTEYWPVARGFNHFYGMPEGASTYFHPRMVIDEQRQPQENREGFYLTDALSDTAACYISNHDFKDKPLFLYMAYNAPHWPLHALREDIEKNIETYRAGWDALREERMRRQKEMGLFPEDTELSPRDANVPAWDSLSKDEQDEFVMRMAIYAAQINAIDRGVGKIVQALKDAGEFENTIIMFLDDNGACAEYNSGGPSREVTGQADTWESYRINWANLSSTPYRLYKHYTTEGGIATPLIVSWPNGIDGKMNGSFVREYGYLADIMATCVEVSGAGYPKTYKGNEIIPCEGVSLVPNFSGKQTDRGMTFLEHEGKIAVRDGDWKFLIINEEGGTIDMTNYELYNIREDPTELHNLASQRPDLVEKYMAEWTRWAEKLDILPLSCDGYGERQQATWRKINGSFDDNLGGWNVSAKEGISFSVERERPLTGAKSAKVTIERSGTRPSDAFMKWNFPAYESETAAVGFSYNSTEDNYVRVRLERANNPEIKALDKKVRLSKGCGKVYFDDIVLEKGRRYVLSLYFGDSKKGEVLLDDVELILD